MPSFHYSPSTRRWLVVSHRARLRGGDKGKSLMFREGFEPTRGGWRLTERTPKQEM